ncbi:MAG: hypothetical protein AMXMBFR45_09830 [Gammaproteobacteria bacterium]|nr:hypothetical protein [Gammaproteobacteria bacterium]MCE7895621.1 hypothetical protein [Gammaproteobacteria bacterium PRO8]MCL4776596.1 hypothetical protein [Gammaproteobacteria bacterium]MDL1880882.1 hypothetical protein [Gammaproteobacteria bacterium PRO2]GIK34753.1 MAG: hypothetical protein BroJett010_13120 [Gammaproteobacteria bacterium]
MADAIFATYSIGMAGMRRSLAELRQQARTVAHATVDGAAADLNGAMVRSRQAELAAEANANAVKRADQARGSVIDLLA